jgi:putative RNA 2'-phosphotransferase
MDRQLSKRLSWLLRHGANEAGVPMDPAGWVSIDAVLAAVRVGRADLLAVVEENDKQRLQLDGDRIRATQGHSLDGTPVTVSALEASWERIDPQAIGRLFHGTRTEVVPDLLREGIRAMDRTHVHLADAREAKVGKRAQVAVLVVVDPTRIVGGVFRSPNGVVLTRHVPPEAIVDLEARTRAAETPVRALRASLVAGRV